MEFLGIWEKLNNPNFNCAEFDIIKSQAGLNSYLERKRVDAKKQRHRHHFQGREIRIVKGSQSNYLKRQWMKSNG